MMLTTEKTILNEEREVSLVSMIQAVGGEFGKIENRPAILILPGGGYFSCSDREAEVIAYPYLQAGYHAFVLRYSVAKHRTWPNPLNDYEQAMKLIHSKAQKWQIISDKIAVIGFSAGGHLAACAATMSKNRPNAAILGYAAMGARIVNLMHSESPAPIPAELVDGSTCPCFLFAARDDSTVPVRNTLDFEQALVNNDIAFESHIYSYGGHGFSTGNKSLWAGKQCSRTPHWVNDSIEWLGDVLGYLTPAGMTEPVCPGKINGNSESVLSVDCTLDYLLSMEGSVAKLLDDIMVVLKKAFPAVQDNPPSMSEIILTLKLVEVMSVLGMEETAIKQMDDTLRQISNKR